MINRYAKQELFIGKTGQEQVNEAHIVIIGAGALGSASSEMLARAGVGKLTIIDRDYVEYSNLQRQQLYTEQDANDKLPKAIAAQQRLQLINSEIVIDALIMDVNASNVEQLIKTATIIVDATDNFDTRLIVNDAAVKMNKPFVFGACVGSYGLQFTIIPDKTPCLHCLVDHIANQQLTCDIVGVISPIVQIIASFQVTQVLRLLSGHSIEPTLKSIDIWKEENAAIHIASLKNKDCPTCGNAPIFPFLSLNQTTKMDVLCGRDAVQIRPSTPKRVSIEDISKRIHPLLSNTIVNSYLLSGTMNEHRIVLFQDGRAIIHGTHDINEARALYHKVMQYNH